MPTINRRNFIKSGGAVAAGMLLLPACSPKIKEGASFRSFTNTEGACIMALCEQIIPAGDQYGGASDAGVIYYIDIQLLGHFKEHAKIYHDSLKKLQTHCNNEFGKQFQNLSSEQQIDVMTTMEHNKIDAGLWESPSGFFQLIRSHTMQGYYGSPIHGGNRDYMSFDMLGLEYPLNIGQNRYRKPLHKI